MSLNVLVVDDSFVMRGMIIKTLKATGLALGEIFQAANGSEALKVLETAWVDLTLVDINMPVMNGEEFLDRLRLKEETRNLPVIVVSSESSETRIERLRKRKVDFIHKPFTPEELRDKVIALAELREVPIQEDQLRSAAAEALEKMCFLVPNGEAGGSTAPLAAAMQVRFTGPYCGHVVLAVDAGLYEAVATNMLGEIPTQERQRRDALGEMANVICGNLVALLGGARGDFQLETPEPGATERGLCEDGAARVAQTRLTFDEGSLELALCRDPAPRNGG